MKERVFSFVLLMVLAVGTAGLVVLSIATIAAEPGKGCCSAPAASSASCSNPASGPCSKPTCPPQK